MVFEQLKIMDQLLSFILLLPTKNGKDHKIMLLNFDSFVFTKYNVESI